MQKPTHLENVEKEPARVLVVDDLEANRYSFSQVLKNEPYIVDLAASANEALGLLVKSDYICVLCDLQMPDIDGLEFTRIVRNDPDISEMPILFITAHDFQAEKIYEAFGLDAYDFIQKPVDPIILRGKLRVFLTLFNQRQEIKRQAEDLKKYSHQLEETNRELEEFSFIASHDLKSPLRAISGLATMVFEDSADCLSDKSKRHLTLLLKRITRMSGLLNDLLTYSRAGRDIGQIGQRDFESLIQDEILNVLDIPKEFQVEIQEGKECIFETYLVPLATCIRNLVANSIKHHHRKEGVIKISCKSLPKFFEISVADDGPGIPEKYQKQIFEIFTTLRSRDEVEASGVGLSVVKRTMSSLGGTVSVSSQEGAGSEFSLFWPKHVGSFTNESTRK